MDLFLEVSWIMPRSLEIGLNTNVMEIHLNATNTCIEIVESHAFPSFENKEISVPILPPHFRYAIMIISMNLDWISDHYYKYPFMLIFVGELHFIKHESLSHVFGQVIIQYLKTYRPRYIFTLTTISLKSITKMLCNIFLLIHLCFCSY